MTKLCVFCWKVKCLDATKCVERQKKIHRYGHNNVKASFLRKMWRLCDPILLCSDNMIENGKIKRKQIRQLETNILKENKLGN